MSRLTEIKTINLAKYKELHTSINEAKPTKIIWGYPDIVEMTDKDGKVHTYSIIELLDGLKALAQQMKKEQQ